MSDDLINLNTARYNMQKIAVMASLHEGRLNLTPTKSETKYYRKNRMFSITTLLTLFSNMMNFHR